MPVSLKTYQRVSFCFWNDFLARETRNAAEFARADPGMVPEETGEMSRLGKAEFGADGVKRLRPIEHEIDRALHPQHVHVDFRRSTDGGFEQAEEMRPRQSGFLGPAADALGAQAAAVDRRNRTTNPPIAGHAMQLAD